MLTAALCFSSLTAVPSSAHAVDGCLVLLCFAAPSWSAIPQCVPPIHQVLADLARGRVFPTCAFAGPGNGASHTWAVAPSNCPAQYTHITDQESTAQYTCDYTGAISVSIGDVLWSRTWWSAGGGTVTEYAPAAKARLGTWDSRFDDDYATWLATQPSPSPASCASC